MSGGYFNYNQYLILDIIEKIEKIVYQNDDTSLNEWSNPRGRGYTQETIKEFQNGINLLRKAQIYAQRIDWLLSCDDCEEGFHKCLARDLEELSKDIFRSDRSKYFSNESDK
jgi:hypothetical protein